MIIYKTIFKILRANLSTLLIGAAITAFVTVTQSNQIQSNQTVAQKAEVVILSKDDSALSRSLKKYLAREQTVVRLGDTSQRGLDDAMYFGAADVIVTIPKDFGQQFSADQSVRILTRARPGSFAKPLVDSSINNFLNTYRLYQKNQTAAQPKEIMRQTQKTLAKKGKIHFDATYRQKRNQSIAAVFVGLLAYGLFMTILSAYGLVNLTFNRSEIKLRNSCSPVSRRNLSRKISLGVFTYSAVMGILFTAFVFFFARLSQPQLMGLFALNILVFFIAMISFSVMVASLVKNSETISGVNNVFILGSCFLSGVFVPAEFLPDIVNKVASFTPTYWFVKANQLVGDTIHYDSAFYQKLGLNLLVLLAFSVAFLVIHRLTIQDKKTEAFPPQPTAK